MENIEAALSCSHRAASGLDKFKALDLSSEEEEATAFEYWHLGMTEKIIDGDFASAYRYIKAAALGERVFEGPERECRGHLEGLPVGLMCSPDGVMRMVQVLYREMMRRGVFTESLNPFKEYPSWTVDSGNGKKRELLPCGHQVACILHRQHNLHSCIAALQVLAIAEWAHNHRRLASPN